jgi:hypothetical protein
MTDRYGVTIWGGAPPPSPEYVRSAEEVRRDEEKGRISEMLEAEADEVITLQEKGFEGPLFDEQEELTEEVRSLLKEPNSNLWAGMGVYFDRKGGGDWQKA